MTEVIVPERETPARLLGIGSVTAMTLGAATLAVLAASGTPDLVPPFGGHAAFVDLGLTMRRQNLIAAMWAAAMCGAGGTLAGLAALRRGWRPDPRWFLAAGVVAVVVFAVTPPVAAVDVLNYAEYGRMVVLGHSPWVMTPQDLFARHDPVGLLRPVEWQDQPTVYGPVAALVQAGTALLGGASMGWIVFWIKVVNGAAYVGVAALLDRLAGPEPSARVRAALLWAVNPLTLFWGLGGGHVDVLAVLALVGAVCLARGSGRTGGFAAGLAAGLAVAVKVSFAAPVLGLMVAARRRPWVPLGAGLVLVAGYAVAGPAALHALSERVNTADDSFLPLPGWIAHNSGLYFAVTAVLVIAFAALLTRVLPDPQPMLVLALASVLVAPVQYPWYDVMLFPLLALVPATGLDALLTVRCVLISCVLFPGVGVTGVQYRLVRWAVCGFLVVFVAITLRAATAGGGPAGGGGAATGSRGFWRRWRREGAGGGWR